MERLMTTARGDWQRGIVAELLNDGWMFHPVNSLTGAARRYNMRYEASLSALMKRLRAMGCGFTTGNAREVGYMDGSPIRKVLILTHLPR